MPSDEVSEVLDFAQEFDRSIQHAIRAHSECARTPGDAVRYHDRLTPYAVHPIWCATTLLSETHLPTETRRVGYQALLWHDVLEDTDLGLPAGVDPAVAKLVEGMTFNSFAEERREVWERPSLVKLLKLYDKVSNLLDGSWVSHEKWDVYVEHASKLNRFVREKYGELNITRMALPFLAPRPVVGPGGLPGMAIDPLTQLPNRNSVLEWADARLPAQLAAGRRVWLAFLNLDALRDVNDALGVAAGDTILFGLSRVLQLEPAYRVGGNEFLCVYEDESCDQVVQACQRIATRFASNRHPAHHPDRAGDVMTLSFSMGALTQSGRDALIARMVELNSALSEQKAANSSRFAAFVQLPER